MRAYVDNPDVEVVALVDPSEERRAQRQADWPEARTFASAAELAASGLEVDAVEALLPIPLHVDGVIELLGYGWHVNLQKPMCNDLAGAQRMLDAAAANDRVLRVMENYLFYEPLRKLKETVESGELGEVSGYHMKMVGSGRGGWDVPDEQLPVAGPADANTAAASSCSTTAGTSSPPRCGSSARSRKCARWIGGTEVVPGFAIDAPTTIVWEHDNGIRGVWDITLAIDMYLRSDYYTNDERWEVTGRRGYARVNRCTGRGIQQPSLEVYADGEMRVVPRARRRLGQQLPRLRPPLAALAAHRRGPDARGAPSEAVDVLRFALAAYASSEAGGTGIDPASVE